MNAVQYRLCLSDIASQLKAHSEKTDDGRILRTKITGALEVFSRGGDIARGQIGQRRIGEQKDILWIELNGLRVKQAALFPLSLTTSNGSQSFRGHGIVGVLPPDRFKSRLGTFVITLNEIFIGTVRQLRLDQVRSELHRHVEGLARRFTSLQGFIVIDKYLTVLSA